MEVKSINASTKDRIISATLDIIAAEGFQNVTIRKIAAMAGVNVAAVNYHFGSKDMVINEALKYITIQMKSAFNYLQDGTEAPEIKLEKFIIAYIDTLYKYPDLIKNMIDRLIHNNQVQIEFEEYLKSEGMELVKKNLRFLRPDEDDSLLNMRTIELFSAISYPVLLGNTFNDILKINLNKAEMRTNYTHLLIDTML